MSRSPRSTSIRRLRPGPWIAALALVFLLAPAAAQATDDRLEWLDLVGLELDEPLFRPNEDWRARGLAYVDLPLQIRARFDARYTRFRTMPDHMAADLISQAGPGLRFERQIQSRITLARPIAEGIELEFVWETRNRIEANDPMGFGRQIVGAMIRITP